MASSSQVQLFRWWKPYKAGLIEKLGSSLRISLDLVNLSRVPSTIKTRRWTRKFLQIRLISFWLTPLALPTRRAKFLIFFNFPPGTRKAYDEELLISRIALMCRSDRQRLRLLIFNLNDFVANENNERFTAILIMNSPLKKRHWCQWYFSCHSVVRHVAYRITFPSRWCAVWENFNFDKLIGA